MKLIVLIASLLLVSCGREEDKSVPKAVAAPTAKPASAPEKKAPPVPQGKLPKMDPEKSKFIAVPSTPKDPEVKKAAKPSGKVERADVPTKKDKK